MLNTITTVIDGTMYTGTLYIRPVGRGKVMFELSYGMHTHHDKSLFRADSLYELRFWAEYELWRMVRKSLGK
jgi:hypothetical protein